eukprot:3218783-Alexandrium_andersonii.AAC.1
MCIRDRGRHAAYQPHPSQPRTTVRASVIDNCRLVESSPQLASLRSEAWHELVILPEVPVAVGLDARCLKEGFLAGT